MADTIPYHIQQKYANQNLGWCSTDINGELDQKRNTLAIGQICHNYNIPFYTFNCQWFYPHLDLGRDLLHVGPKTHESVAERIVKEFNL